MLLKHGRQFGIGHGIWRDRIDRAAQSLFFEGFYKGTHQVIDVNPAEPLPPRAKTTCAKGRKEWCHLGHKATTRGNNDTSSHQHMALRAHFRRGVFPFDTELSEEIFS